MARVGSSSTTRPTTKRSVTKSDSYSPPRRGHSRSAPQPISVCAITSHPFATSSARRLCTRPSSPERGGWFVARSHGYKCDSMTHVLRFGRTRAIPFPDRRAVSVGSARRTAIASAILEISCASALLVFVHQMNNDDGLAIAVGLTCAVLLVGRMAVGLARAAVSGAVAFGLLTLL